MGWSAPRACLQSQQPDKDAGDVDHGHEVAVEILRVSGNPSELFDPIEETFDEVAVLVPVAIIFALLDAVVVRGDDGLGPEGPHFPDEAVSVIRPVSDHPLGTEALKQRRGLGDVGGRMEPRRQPRRSAR